MTVRTSVDGRWAKVVVEDRGIGIAPETMPHIFGRFERGVPSTNYGGLGLGLYIVQEIVQAHGGYLGVDSELGAWTRFTVGLPRIRARCGGKAPTAEEKAG